MSCFSVLFSAGLHTYIHTHSELTPTTQTVESINSCLLKDPNYKFIHLFVKQGDIKEANWAEQLFPSFTSTGYECIQDEQSGSQDQGRWKAA